METRDTEMKDKGILFTPDMAKAADEGRKTQTRRIIKNPGRLNGLMLEGEESEWCPYKVGQKLYLKETHYRYGQWVKNGLTKTGKQAWRFKGLDIITKPLFFEDTLPDRIRYAVHSDTCHIPAWYKRTPLFMPKKFARKWFVVTAVECERVQDISVDAIAEGARYHVYSEAEVIHSQQPRGYWYFEARQKKGLGFGSPMAAFADLWTSIHGIGTPKSWEANPWVWKVTFKKLDKD